MRPRHRFRIRLAVLLVFAAVVIILWHPWKSNKPAISAQAAEQAVLGQYPGTIERNVLEDGLYKLQLRTESGLYRIDLDSRTGRVNAIRLVEAASGAEPKTLQSRDQIKAKLQSRIDGTINKLELVEREGNRVYQAEIVDTSGLSKELVLDPYTGETISSRDLPSVSQGDDSVARLLKESEAAKLALAEIPGTVDDVDLRGVDSGLPYYLVEIDLKDGREATVEVNAISGDIQSVTWERDEPDE